MSPTAPRDGVVRIDAAGTKVCGSAEGVRHESIHALTPDDQGSAWLGVGMVQLRPRIIRSYIREDGLPTQIAVRTSSGSSEKMTRP